MVKHHESLCIHLNVLGTTKSSSSRNIASNINPTAYSNGITGNNHGKRVFVGISIPVPLIPNGQTVVKRICEFSSNSSYKHFMKPTTASVKYGLPIIPADEAMATI
ncbi:hypothetical protein DERF_010908 [Dermatophagoides farinae]|uniref:Uncharacterized protein n=1 Tax=Dermatophagoides farinae TaxID=6954 RepID=A0A922HUD5_DERFA|nr:hypothetical protein DERF_010908 [Dermatophagoides farinae]